MDFKVGQIVEGWKKHLLKEEQKITKLYWGKCVFKSMIKIHLLNLHESYLSRVIFTFATCPNRNICDRTEP